MRNSGPNGLPKATTIPSCLTGASWDINANLSANNFIQGYTKTVTSSLPSSSSIFLAPNSTYLQHLTGTGFNIHVVLPPVDSLPLGHQFRIVTDVSNTITVQASGPSDIQTMIPSSNATFTVISNLLSQNNTAWHCEYSLSSVISTPTVSTYTGWDSNKNLSANNHISGFQSFVTAAGTTTLFITSPSQIYFTGTNTQTVKLPTTSVVAGVQYVIVNNSTGVVTVQSSGSNTIQAMPTGSQLTVTALVATPTTDLNWNAQMSMNGLILGTTPTVSKTSATAANGGTNTYSGGFNGVTSGNYTTPAGVSYLVVELIGGGAGGVGGGTSGAGAGTGGGTTTFGTSLLTATGGNAGIVGGGSGAGGTATISAPAVGTPVTGGTGAGLPVFSSDSHYTTGGMGASTPFGGGGGGSANGSGYAGALNSGAGGSGGGTTNTASDYGGAGGSAGGYISAIVIPTAGQVFAFSIGSGGSGGTAGSNGYAGTLGGGGFIRATEFYNSYSVSSVLVGVSPTVTRLTAASGNYTTPAGVQYLIVEQVGGGGGGGNSSTSSSSNAGAGGDSSFGTSLITTKGGNGGNWSANATNTANSASTINLPAVIIKNQLGQTGNAGGGAQSTQAYSTAGVGGSNPLGAGAISVTNAGGAAAGANTGGGGGGGGAGNVSGAFAGNGGNSGNYVQALIVPTAGQVFAYVNGAGGPGSSITTGSGTTGGNGGTALTIVTEYYTNLAIGTQVAIPANYFMAGPTSGASAQPNFRALANADLPAQIGLYTSSRITTNSTAVTSSTFTTFSNSPALTFTPTVSGTYKVYSNVALQVQGTNLGAITRIVNTTGGATLLAESGSSTATGGANAIENGFIQSVYTLTAGTSYVFDIQGAGLTAFGTIVGIVLNGGYEGFYMFAEYIR